MAEFVAEGRGPGDTTMIGSEIGEFGPYWDEPAGFETYVRHLCSQPDEEYPRPDGHVPSTTLWWVEGDEFLGRIAIRHRLTAYLLEAGGHIGYDVRPSARLKGHATAMLAAALPIAYKLGIDPALVTCDVDNVGSRKVIENNRGLLEDQRAAKLRYWVTTSTGL
jgi:predicted acetyltransferase